MTFLLTECPPDHSSRQRDEELVLALNTVTDKLLYYKPSSHVQKFNIPLVSNVQLLFPCINDFIVTYAEDFRNYKIMLIYVR